MQEAVLAAAFPLNQKDVRRVLDSKKSAKGNNIN